MFNNLRGIAQLASRAIGAAALGAGMTFIRTQSPRIEAPIGKLKQRKIPKRITQFWPLSPDQRAWMARGQQLGSRECLRRDRQQAKLGHPAFYEVNKPFERIC